ncbi:archease [Candidatus Micrarchaeota archaeon]|nr:archease [Candidatus Micrarchaeota archaeon]
MGYRFVDGVAIADVSFQADGETLEELFESCGKALTNSMVTRLESIDAEKEIKLEIESDNTEKLLYEFLDDLIFYKDAELMLFRKYEIKIDGNKLTATLGGEKINPQKHELIIDVKAVSWHMFRVEKKEKWEAFVILDV